MVAYRGGGCCVGTAQPGTHQWEPSQGEGPDPAGVRPLSIDTQHCLCPSPVFSGRMQLLQKQTGEGRFSLP